MEIKYTQTEKAPAAIGPYSQAVSVGNLLFTSGQIPIDPATGEIAGATIEEQARQSVANVGAILEANGTSFDKVVKTTCFLDDINDFVAFNEVYARYFDENLPARSAVGVEALPKGALVEVEVIAYVGSEPSTRFNIAESF